MGRLFLKVYTLLLVTLITTSDISGNEDSEVIVDESRGVTPIDNGMNLPESTSEPEIIVDASEGFLPIENGTDLTGNYFLSPKELKVQVKKMTEFIEKQLALPGSSEHTTANTKVNLTALGFPDLRAFRQIFHGIEDNLKRDAVCSGCQVFFGVMAHQIRFHKTSQEKLIHFATFTCTFFRLAIHEVCDGIMTRLGPSFYWIVQQKKQTTPTIMCGLMFQSLGCKIPERKLVGTEFDWNVDSLGKPGHLNPFGVPRPVVHVSASNDFRNPQTLTKESGIMKIVHLADMHIDYDYMPGTKAECDNEILCCQERNGYPQGNEVGAGQYGDNRKCDAPISILHMALEHIRSYHGEDIDLIYMTGDLVPHNIWYSTEENNTDIIQRVSKVIYDYFPTATVIPCLGNHEAHPVNFYSPTSKTYGSSEANPIPQDLRSDWVYEVAYESWKQWIPPDQKETFLKSGHYAVEINKKFRVLVVNTNVCYGFNMWQLYDPQDPGGQLEWLQKQLALTDSLNKTTHIVGHVPPGHEDCFKTWSREFYKIVSKYRHIIKGQFYGHTHYDEFRILHDPVYKNDPINIMWVGPSLTPYRIHNPGYRIYHADLGYVHTYGDIIDHETWIYDVDKANKEFLADPTGSNVTQVQWFLEYKATEAYQIENLLPVNLKKFISRMAKDRKTFDLFYRYYFKATKLKFQEDEPCDTVCLKRILCGIVRSYYDDDDGQVECATIQKDVDGIVLPMRVLEHRKRFVWL